jgi:hypothetical protein
MDGTVLVSFPEKVCLIQLYSLGILLLKYAHVFSGFKRRTLHTSMRHLQCSARGCESAVYLCTLFNDAGNNEGHTASKGKDIDVSRKRMHLGGTGRGLMMYCLVICIKVLRKATKDIRQDTMFRHLPYTPLRPVKC